MGFFWNHFGTISESFRVHVDIILASFSYYGSICVHFGDHLWSDQIRSRRGGCLIKLRPQDTRKELLSHSCVEVILQGHGGGPSVLLPDTITFGSPSRGKEIEVQFGSLEKKPSWRNRKAKTAFGAQPFVPGIYGNSRGGTEKHENLILIAPRVSLSFLAKNAREV